MVRSGPILRNALICSPQSAKLFQDLPLVGPEFGGLGLRLQPSPLCPPDEAWVADSAGNLTRYVWGERHNKSMAAVGPRDVDANGAPVEAA